MKKYTLFIGKAKDLFKRDNEGFIQTNLLDKIKGHYIEVYFGVWIFKTKEAYPIFAELCNIFKAKDHPHFMLQFDDPIIFSGLPQYLLDEFEKFDFEIYHQHLDVLDAQKDTQA